MANKFIVIKLGDELFGIPVSAVERILPDQKVTKVPNSGRTFLGTFDLRGESLPAYELRRWLEMPTFEGESNFLVVENASRRVAIRVDAVDGIAEYPSRDLLQHHPMLESDKIGIFSSVVEDRNRLIAMLNPETLLQDAARHSEQSGAA